MTLHGLQFCLSTAIHFAFHYRNCPQRYGNSSETPKHPTRNPRRFMFNSHIQIQKTQGVALGYEVVRFWLSLLQPYFVF